MTDDQPPRGSADSDDQPIGSGQGWAAVSYLVGGIAVWGFVGWLVDEWLGLGGIGFAAGAVLGAAGGVYLIARRLGGL